MILFSFILTNNTLKITEETQNNQSFPKTAQIETINYDWLQTWRETGYNCGLDIAIDKLSNIYLTGYSDGQACLIKYTHFGQQLWNKTYIGIDGTEAITVDDENNFYMVGGHNNIYLLKVNQTGDIQWHEIWGGTEQEDIASVGINSKGDLYVLGSTRSYGAGECDIVLLKYNQTGGLQWFKTWGYQWFDYARDMFIDSNDNLFVVGSTELVYDKRTDICIIKFDSNGNQLFNSTWGIYDIHDNGYSIVLDSSKDIYVSGSRSGNLTIVKFDSQGNFLWDQTKSITDGSYYHTGNSLILDNSENLIVSCFKDYNLGILKYNKTGHLISEYSWSNEIYGQPASENKELCEVLLIDSFNNIFIAGYIVPDGGYDPYMFLMKCNSEFGINMESNAVFSYEKTFFEWFHTNLERIPLSHVYQDQDWRAFVTLNIEGYNNYFLIYFIDRGFARNIKLCMNNKINQTEHSLDIEMYKPYNFTYNRNIQFRIYFNYSYAYESCIDWIGIYCTETEIKTITGEFYSDYFSISSPSNRINNSITGFNLHILIGFLLLMSLLIRNKLKEKNKKF